MTTFQTISEVRDANKAAGHNFFARGTMRFFNSRVVSQLYGHRYFITSERCDPTSLTRYTVRRANEDGSIDTVGDFQQYAHIDDARQRAHIEAYMPQDYTCHCGLYVRPQAPGAIHISDCLFAPRA